MSRKLIVLNINGREYLGEEPSAWPPPKGEEFSFRQVMLIDHQVVGTQQGPARLVFMHPVSDYRLRGFYPYRPPTDKEKNVYLQERETKQMVRPVIMPPEMERKLREEMPEELRKHLAEGGAVPPPAALISSSREG